MPTTREYMDRPVGRCCASWQHIGHVPGMPSNMYASKSSNPATERSSRQAQEYGIVALRVHITLHPENMHGPASLLLSGAST